MNMTKVLVLAGDKNPLKVSFFPPLDLETEYELGLLSVHGRNVAPNITRANNCFHYDQEKQISVPPGYYTIPELSECLDRLLIQAHPTKIEDATHRKQMNHNLVRLTWNSVIERLELLCCFRVDPKMVPFNLVKALGFEEVIPAYKKTIAENEMKFYLNGLMRVNCDVVKGCYYNGEPTQTVHEFSCTASPGARFEEKPPVVSYFPVCERSSLSEVRATLCNQQNDPLNLRDQLLVVRLHLRRQNASGI